MKTEPLDIWAEYQSLTQYLYRHHVYDIVKMNENFYDGRQWEGLETNNFPTPVFNVLQRAGKFMVATIGSNDIAIMMLPFSEVPDDIEKADVIAKEIENIIELAQIKEDSKIVIRNAFVDGSSYMLQMFDPDFETMQPMKGRVVNKVIDNTNVYFGNPYSNDLQSQPFIIVALRQYVTQVKEEAKRLGLRKDTIELITPDSDYNQANDDSTKLVTVLLKFYKKRTKVEEEEVKIGLDGEPVVNKNEHTIETVWFTKTTQNVTLIKPTDLGYRRYPLSCFGWDLIKNSYLYNSPITSVIPNQIFINKTYAIAQMYGLQSAFPKIIYDKNKVEVQELMDNVVMGISGVDIMGKFLDFLKIPDFSNQIIELARDVISTTKDMMGVTDASLGNVRPDNTSAIIALQETSTVPLEIQKQSFYRFWEDTVRNVIDIVACSYGVREVMTDDNKLAIIDFSKLKDLNYNLKVEIGNSAQFSEIAQINTLDKLVQAGYIMPDEYMDAVPSKYIPKKAKLLKQYKERMAQMQQAQPMQPMMSEPRGSTPADETVPL